MACRENKHSVTVYQVYPFNGFGLEINSTNKKWQTAKGDSAFTKDLFANLVQSMHINDNVTIMHELYFYQRSDDCY